METLQEYNSLALAKDSGIVTLTFTQANKANAMGRSFWTEFPDAIKKIENDSETRVLIIKGAGKHFSAGMDLSIFASSEMLDTSSARHRNRLKRLVLDLQSCFSALEKLPVPVIAQVQGACVGAALDLICACDMRYAASDAYFCLQEINLAMMADLGVLQRLPRLIPFGIAAELAFTGERLPAVRAEKLGLLNQIFSSETELELGVRAVAEKICLKSPLAVSASKDALLYAREACLDDSLSQAANLQSAIFEPDEIRQAAEAAARKLETRFDKLLSPGKL